MFALGNGDWLFRQSIGKLLNWWAQALFLGPGFPKRKRGRGSCLSTHLLSRWPKHFFYNGARVSGSHWGLGFVVMNLVWGVLGVVPMEIRVMRPRLEIGRGSCTRGFRFRS